MSRNSVFFEEGIQSRSDITDTMQHGWFLAGTLHRADGRVEPQFLSFGQSFLYERYVAYFAGKTDFTEDDSLTLQL